MLYQRIMELDQPSNESTYAQSTRLGKRTRDDSSLSPRKRRDGARIEENSEGEVEDEIHHFRRVHVVHKYLCISELQSAVSALLRGAWFYDAGRCFHCSLLRQSRSPLEA